MIIHFYDEKEQHYLCNFACNTLLEKRTTEEEKVTCLNCIRRINKKKGKIERIKNAVMPKLIKREDIPRLKKIVEGLPNA